MGAVGERWAHRLEHIEQGCVLLSHPEMFRGGHQTYFHQAVIFVISHSHDHTAGIILNRPTQYTMGQVGGSSDLLPAFQENRLFLGGDVNDSVLYIMHTRQGLEGASEIVDGVYLGGHDACKAAVEAGDAPASDFKWFTRNAG